MYKNIFIFYNSMKKKYTILSAITILLLTVISSSFFFTTANGQQRLSVLLIHGYLNDASVWDDWVSDLETAGFNVKAVEFNGNDRCGSAADHAKQLINIVEEFKASTGSDKINIVAHSKGGLDARVYLANNPTIDDVANLIMIGTPNAGSPRAENRDPGVIDSANRICWPFSDEAINDLKEGAPATKVGKNTHTEYHTTAGDWKAIFDGGMFIPTPPFGIPVWIPVDNDCIDTPLMFNYQLEGSGEINGPDDGIVPLESVESGGFNSLGHTDNCHTNLFSNEEFNKAMTILRQ
jgi:pimeloyl-ACP methyl ester carboxylesterase